MRSTQIPFIWGGGKFKGLRGKTRLISMKMREFGLACATFQWWGICRLPSAATR
jgi:hypothetical protein